MKIGLVLSRPPVYSESFLNSKITGLIKNGIDVELFVNNNDPLFDLCKVNALPANFFHGFFYLIKTVLFHPFRSVRLISKDLSDGRSIKTIFYNLYTNVHLLNAANLTWVHFSFMTTTVGRENIAGALGVKMGVSIRGYDISRYPIKHPSVYRNTWNKIDKIHYLSEALLNKAYKEGLKDKPEVPCTMITPAVDTSLFGNINRVYNFKQPIKILSIARLHWVKGLDHTIQALSYLHQKGIDFVYTIIGDGKELERLTYTCFMYGITDKVRFIGKVDHSNIKTYYEESDLYLQYSIQEGFCNAVLEAQAMGLPCIVSDAEGLPENIINNSTGWVVPSCSPHLLADKIKEVIDTDPDEIAIICKNAQHRIKKSFNIHDQQTKFANFYSK